jgi:hypothetical protein
VADAFAGTCGLLSAFRQHENAAFISRAGLHLHRVRRPPEQTEHDFKEAKLQDFMLFNLKTDIGETHDLAAAEPAKLAELKPLLQAK